MSSWYDLSKHLDDSSLGICCCQHFEFENDVNGYRGTYYYQASRRGEPSSSLDCFNMLHMLPARASALF